MSRCKMQVQARNAGYVVGDARQIDSAERRLVG